MSAPTLTARPLPSSPELEAQALSSVFIDPSDAWPMVATLPEEAFYGEAARRLYQTMRDLWQRGEPVEEPMLLINRAGELGHGTWVNLAYVAGVMTAEPTAAYVEHHVRKLRELHGRREAIRRAYELALHATEGDISLEELATLASQVALPLEPTITSEVVTQEDAVARALEIIERGPVNAIPTGLNDLDDEIVGLEGGALYVLAARPAMGKTAMGYSWVLNAAKMGKHAVVCSLEMPAEQLTLRALATAANVSLQKIRLKQTTDAERERLHRAAPAMARLPISYFDSSDQTGTAIARRVRDLKAKGRCDLLFVDYLQLVEPDSTSGGRGNGMNRVNEVSAISRNLKKLARELNVPVVVLSQLSRAVEQRPNHRPVLSDLRESGAVEQDADCVMFIYRDEYYNPETTEESGVAEVIIGKQRNGPVGTVKVAYDEERVRFSNLARFG